MVDGPRLYTGKPLYLPLATGAPFRGHDAKFAARELLLAVWKEQMVDTDGSLEGAFVDEEGLLTRSDIKRIEREAVLARERWISSIVERRGSIVT